MERTADRAAPRCRPTPAECSVAAAAAIEAAPADIARLRESPPGRLGAVVPGRFLRYSDDQTVIGLAAVLKAIDEGFPAGHAFHDWGVLAAPRYLGRIVGAAAIAKYQKGGPGTISPHMIPQQSLHSVASAIGIALGMHGPTFAIGGGPEALEEGVVTALTFLQGAAFPGLWLVLTGWAPEPVPSPEGTVALPDDAVCSAVALALVPGGDGDKTLRWSPGPAPRMFAGGRMERRSVQLREFARAAAGECECGAVWRCDLAWGGSLALFSQQRSQRKAS